MQSLIQSSVIFYPPLFLFLLLLLRLFPTIRVLMRQDLMRQQALEEEEKETQQQHKLRLADSVPSTSSPISVSVSSSSRAPAQVPVEVLKVWGGWFKKTKNCLVVHFKDIDLTFPAMELCYRCRLTWRTQPVTTSSKLRGSKYASTCPPHRASVPLKQPMIDQLQPCQSCRSPLPNWVLSPSWLPWTVNRKWDHCALFCR